MTITVPILALPLSLTIIIALVALYGIPESRGPYDIGSAIEGLLRVAGAVIAILLVWIAYLLVRP